MSKFSCILVVFSILLLLKEATADQIPITALPSVAMVPVQGSPGLFALVPIDVPITGTRFNRNDGVWDALRNTITLQLPQVQRGRLTTWGVRLAKPM